MLCRICENDARQIFTAICLRKYTIHYFLCDNCGFLQTEEPYWLGEAYKEPINETDTGILSRNLYLSNVTTTILFFLFDKNGVFLDHAGGYGILTRLMRDSGFDFYWSDPYAKNIFSKGFEFDVNHKAVDLITCYEAIEHFVRPMQEIGKMVSLSRNLLFTTELLPSPVPPPSEWWYYGLEHGQHVSFYSARTLRHIAQRFDMNFYTDNRFVHLLTSTRINAKFYRMLVRMSSFGLGHLVRLLRKGKTFSDMETLKSARSKCDAGRSVGD